MARVSPVGETDAHQGRAGVAHDRPHVGEVEVDETGHGDQVADPLHALAQHVVRDAERLEHRRRAVEHLEQAIVRDDDEGVANLSQLVGALLGLLAAAAALEPERHRDDADRQRSDLPRDARHDRRRTGARPAAFAGRHEDHVGAAKDVLDLVVRLVGGAAADVWIRAGAEPLGELPADMELHGRFRGTKLLDVGVDRDELDL